MLNRSYKGLILWMIGFIVLILALSFLPIENEDLMMRIVGCACAAGIEGLLLLIYKTEKIFWINGVSYQNALEAGSDRRKAYALKYVKLFGIITVGIFCFSTLAQLLQLNPMIDMAVLVAGTVASAFYTMKFKL